MRKLIDLTTAQLHRAIDIKLQIEALQTQLDSIAGNGDGVPISFTTTKRKKRRMSKAGRARIAAAAKARWAAYRGKGASAAKKPASGKKRKKFSAAARAKLAAAARARWAKAKMAGKTTL
jgi:hypothetical protein